MISPYLIVLGVVFGATIGYLANRLAIWLLFNPAKPVRIWRFKFQGVIPKKKEELVARIASLTAERVLEARDITKAVSEVVERELFERTSKLIGGAIPSPLRELIAEKIVETIAPVLRKEFESLGGRLDVEAIVRRKLSEVMDKDIGGLMREVIGSELRYISLYDSLLGAVVGGVEVFILHLLLSV